jgi:hypothetical protein
MLGPFINFDEDSACAVPATATAKRADSSKAAMRRIDIISAALPLPEPQVTRVGLVPLTVGGFVEVQI